jgi:hypothetical protein
MPADDDKINSGMGDAIRTNRHNIVENLFQYVTINIKEMMERAIAHKNADAISFFLKKDPALKGFVLEKLITFESRELYENKIIWIMLDIIEDIDVDNMERFRILIKIATVITKQHFSDGMLLIEKIISMLKKISGVNYEPFVMDFLDAAYCRISKSVITILCFFVSKQPSVMSAIDEYQERMCDKHWYGGQLQLWGSHLPFDAEILTKSFLKASASQIKYILPLFSLCRQKVDIVQIIISKISMILNEKTIYNRFNSLHSLVNYCNITKTEAINIEETLVYYQDDFMAQIVIHMLKLKYHYFDSMHLSVALGFGRDLLNLEDQCDFDFCMRQYIIYGTNVEIIWKFIIQRGYIIEHKCLLMFEELKNNLVRDIVLNICMLSQLFNFWDKRNHDLHMFNDYKIEYRWCEFWYNDAT